MTRCNLLWTGSRMMLAEHRQLLNERVRNKRDESDLKHGNDEQQFEKWQEIWSVAINNNSEIVVLLNNKILKQVVGKIVSWEPEQGYFYIQTKKGERIKLEISEVIDLLNNSEMGD